ncbi:hypothetical protein MNEG_8676, partial [Monoraphidium neglectum]
MQIRILRDLGSADELAAAYARAPELAPRRQPDKAASGSAAAAIPARTGSGGSSSSQLLAERRHWWQQDGPVAAEEIKATTTEDILHIHREFMQLAPIELFALQREEEGWGYVEPRGEDSGGGSGGSGGSGSSEGAAAGSPVSGLSLAAGLGDDSPWAGGGCIESVLYYGTRELPAGYAPGSPHARLFDLMNRFGGAFKFMQILGTPALFALYGANLSTGVRFATPVPDSHWHTVVSKLGLTPQQRADVVAIQKLHAKFMERSGGPGPGPGPGPGRRAAGAERLRGTVAGAQHVLAERAELQLLLAELDTGAASRDAKP